MRSREIVVVRLEQARRPSAFSNVSRAFSLLIAASLSPCFLVSAIAQHGHDHATKEMGTVHFEVSCDDNVVDDFDRALALMHHMQYVESREAFEQISEADPACAMAYWGVAMTRFQPLWPSRPGVDQLKQGKEELQTARAIGIATDREDRLVAAAEAFFREPESADWWTRIQRWSDAMSAAYEAHADDIETAALYALSQLAVGQVAEDRMAHNARAAEVLLSIHEREPTHPGAIHYTIHANDVDARAGESLDVVRSYSAIAPEVPHALHMPTHIFVRLGAWNDVIEWNRRSADAALKLPAGDAISHHYPHAIDYLVHAYLQRGEDDKAKAAIDEIGSKADPFQPTFISAFHLGSIPARYAVERRDWAAAASIAPRTPESVKWDGFWWPEAISWFARGMGAVRTGNVEDAEKSKVRLIELRDSAERAGEQAFRDYIEVDRLILEAWLAHARGDSETEHIARAAAALEVSTQKHPVTPGSIYPAPESLGDILMALNQPSQALEAYEGSLVQWPGRFNSLLGAARAAKAAGDEGKALHYYRKLLDTAPQSNRQVLKNVRDEVTSAQPN
ncbi:MAG: hypothetical protein KJO98_16150 [Rhodothermia bacterium]|nr:hypothetical protein [Rhodothermia bacterium]